MIRRDLKIGRWTIEFYFCPDGYDSDVLIDRLYDFGAGARTMNQSMDIIDNGAMTTGFTFSNPYDHVALVAIGPATSGSEFTNTLSHEMYHVIASIIRELGVDVESETPAYMMGDSMKELADTICELGCASCN